jgi:sporulation protein YlmC with PRC-barrel domain
LLGCNFSELAGPQRPAFEKVPDTELTVAAGTNCERRRFLDAAANGNAFRTNRRIPMKTLTTAFALALLSSAAWAQSPATTTGTVNNTPATTASSSTMTAPKEFTVTDYYKQTVYDRDDKSIGKIDDVLIDREGKITSLIIGVGGFLGMGEKDVAVKFQDVQLTRKNDKWYLVMDANKDTLKAAQGLKYDSNTTAWIPDNGNTNAASNGTSTKPATTTR